MNPQSVLVDANILIAVLDGEDSNPNHIEARKKFNKLLYHKKREFSTF